MRRQITRLQFRNKAKARALRIQPTEPSLWNASDDQTEIPADLLRSLAVIRDEWANCADVKYQFLHVQGVLVCLVFNNGLIDQDAAQRGLLEPLTRYEHDEVTWPALKNIVNTMKTEEAAHFSALHQAIAMGKVAVLVDGQPGSLLVEVNKFPERAVEVSQNEPTIQGPQEAFIENLQTNLALIRKRLRTSKLKVETMQIGTTTNLQLATLYVQGIVKPSLVDEAHRRLQRIQVEDILAANQIREMIDDAPFSPFQLTEITERPDRAVARLLQGGVCFLIDGTPTAISVPVVFVSGLASAEDYYAHFMTAAPLRILRHIMYWSSLLLPSLYIALLTYNQDLVPTPLLISLEGQHEGIPFPTIVEALGMQTAFEALREAGLRLPRTIGQSVSIVGALVIGDAAVNAGIVSPGMVIVVAAAGVASYTLPSQDLANTNRIVQYPFMIAASVLGLYGIVTLGLVLVIHMVSLRSFGIPYMAPLAPFSWPEMRDTFIRAPWWAMNRRPQFYESVDSTRSRTPKPTPPAADST